MATDRSPVLLTGLRLHNVRGFRDLAIRLTQDETEATPRPITLAIGRNGTNKSTLLRAIALCLADDTEAASLLSYPLGSIVRSGNQSATIELDVVELDGETQTLVREIESDGLKDFVTRSSSERGSQQNFSVFVVGYGAGRSTVASDAGRSYRVDDACSSLFDYRRELLHPELALRRLNDYLGTRRYASTLRGIKRVLDMTEEDNIELPRGGGLLVSGPSFGQQVPLDGWADGYRLTFLWLLDLYARAMTADQIDNAGNIRAIVLIDELEQHLHPALQAAILPHLTELLPNAQFVATTHSPLMALGAQPSDLLVLRRTEDEVVIESRVPDYRGYSAEDMLTDDRLFDAPAYAPEAAKQLARYEELVAKGPQDRTRAERRELAVLAQNIHAQPLPSTIDDKVAAALADIARRAAS